MPFFLAVQIVYQTLQEYLSGRAKVDLDILQKDDIKARD
jgi:hypothetical protein